MNCGDLEDCRDLPLQLRRAHRSQGRAKTHSIDCPARPVLDHRQLPAGCHHRFRAGYHRRDWAGRPCRACFHRNLAGCQFAVDDHRDFVRRWEGDLQSGFHHRCQVGCRRDRQVANRFEDGCLQARPVQNRFADDCRRVRRGANRFAADCHRGRQRVSNQSAADRRRHRRDANSFGADCRRSRRDANPFAAGSRPRANDSPCCDWNRQVD
jgi:hypothetical protein